MPSIGKLHKYRTPVGEGIRVDNGILEGMQIPVFYDPILAKLTVHAYNRAAAIEKMKEAIAAYEIEGIVSTLDFGAYVMNHPAFTSGKFDTNFVKLYWNQEKIGELMKSRAEAAAAIAQELMVIKDSSLVVPGH